MESPSLIPEQNSSENSLKKASKRKSNSKSEQNNNKKPKMCSSKEEMFEVYQPWVIQTYGDLAKTKTITVKKYARILRTLRGDELANADNSKFRFWVKAKGFCIGQPDNYEARPADRIVGRFSVCETDSGIVPECDKAVGSARDPALYVPNVTLKNNPSESPTTYRKVAIVENFFDIIYNVHVDLEGRPGKHAGQKRTYRTITETYAFLPREAVTRFLLGCTECQKHPRSPSPPQPSPHAFPLPSTPSPSPPIPQLVVNANQTQKDEPLSLEAELNKNGKSTTTPPNSTTTSTRSELRDVRRDFTPPVNDENRNCQLSVNNNSNKSKNGGNPLDVSNLLAGSKSNKKKSLNHQKHDPPKLWSPVKSIEEEQKKLNPKRILLSGNIDYSMPITTTYLKYMRSLGCKEDEAFNFDNSHENLPTSESEGNDDDTLYNGTKNGSHNDLPIAGGEEMAGLWAQYHSALSLAKGKITPPALREQPSPINAERGSTHDETSSSGNKDDDEDDDDDSDDKIDTQSHDPERLKAFNMFVRLFVDENLDRMVPISKQPKEKIQAIIDSCTRQFPEFAERARKRIRTYLKSCRRNKRARDPNTPWDTSRPTPAHLTSVQAEQILATACENESHNAKRMRLGLEPVSQPMPVLPGVQPTDTTAPIGRPLEFSNCPKIENDVTTTFTSGTPPSSTSSQNQKGSTVLDIKPNLNMSISHAPTTMNGSTTGNHSTSSGTIVTQPGGGGGGGGSAPTAMYRPNFSQAFQRAGPYPLFPGSAPFSTSAGLLTNGPADLSIKQKPLINHKLNAGEMTAVRQLITGYRESAAFLLRSADELEQLLLQQQ